MKLRPLAVLAVAAFSLTGCGVLGSASSASSPSAPRPTSTAATPAATTSAETGSEATSGLGAVKESGDLPDPCTLLTEAQVREITGRDITQIDEDDAPAGSSTRFCQWQQPGGQLAVFLTRTTPADYELVIEEATPVDGLGEKAYTLAGHLYVLYGTVQLDVYARGDSDEENLAEAKKVVGVLLPKV